MPQPRLSVISQTRNAIAGAPGEAIFRRALQSVAWADELIVVDGESQDGTRAVAAEFGAQIHSMPCSRDFVAPKVRALEHATGEWVLWIDADEVIPPALQAGIRRAMARPEADGYRLRRQHIFAGRALRHCGVDEPLRLWRRGVGGFGPALVHESYQVPGPTPTLPDAMLHYSSVTVGSRIEKMVPLAFNQAEFCPDFPAGDGWAYAWRYLVRKPLGSFKNVLVTQRGYRDGIHGLVWAALNAITFFYMNALVWERSRRRE